MEDDYLQISNLIFKYAEVLDRGDSEGIGDLFAHGEFSSETLGGPFRGREEVAIHYRQKEQLFEDGLPWAKHVTSNPIIEIADDGTSATCRSVFVGFQQLPHSKGLVPLAAGRYIDKLEKVDGVWRFKHRHLIRDLGASGLTAYLQEGWTMSG